MLLGDSTLVINSEGEDISLPLLKFMCNGFDYTFPKIGTGDSVPHTQEAAQMTWCCIQSDRLSTRRARASHLPQDW
jgi:hypothetical protein